MADVVNVSANFAELEKRVNTLRASMTKILHKTKEKLEAAAREAGLPVLIRVDASIDFSQHGKEDKK